MTSLSISVHGATGSQGRPVVQILAERGHRVRSISRSLGVDLFDHVALQNAYVGADVVVLQLPLIFDKSAMRQAEAVLTALESSGVPRVVFNTSGGLPESPIGVPFVDARALLASELPRVVETVSCLSPAATYAENLVAPWSAPLVVAGTVAYPLPAEAPIPWVTADDLAAVIADMAVAPHPPRAQLVAGPEDLTGPEVASRLTSAIGREVVWSTITPDEYEQMLRPHLDAETAAGIASSYAAPGAPSDPTLVVRASTTIESWAGDQDWWVQVGRGA